MEHREEAGEKTGDAHVTKIAQDCSVAFSLRLDVAFTRCSDATLFTPLTSRQHNVSSRPRLPSLHPRRCLWPVAGLPRPCLGREARRSNLIATCHEEEKDSQKKIEQAPSLPPNCVAVVAKRASTLQHDRSVFSCHDNGQSEPRPGLAYRFPGTRRTANFPRTLFPFANGQVALNSVARRRPVGSTGPILVECSVYIFVTGEEIL
ncbi:hypothetical protein CLCR_09129 [Cladophialophora carrionii]|uniref:Uncharacterized protein n=1 Tax=Cladophialophora carrionii TaxID=86049 RepID=A0A1C1CR32_9EURO|nr:hypothetical protein CLCR_09129 [Cladophialophora carrionii]